MICFELRYGEDGRTIWFGFASNRETSFPLLGNENPFPSSAKEGATCGEMARGWTRIQNPETRCRPPFSGDLSQ